MSTEVQYYWMAPAVRYRRVRVCVAHWGPVYAADFTRIVRYCMCGISVVVRVRYSYCAGSVCG